MNPQFLLESFHFLRPAWLLLLPPAVLLYATLLTRERRSSNWERVVDRELLPYILVTSGERSGRNPFLALLLAWILSIVAMAGPVWDKLEQPVQQKQDALAVLLDLSLSMYAEDLKPNRLVAAKRKLQDLLDARSEGLTALVVYAGDAHTVSPLTDDAATIASMLPALAPEMMPVPGSSLASALTLANRLFADAGITRGRILVITDEVVDAASSQRIAAGIADDFEVSVLGVGTPDGAPVSLNAIRPGAGYLKDRSGTMVIPQLKRDSLTALAAVAHGRYAEIAVDGSDLAYLLAESTLPDREEYIQLEREFDTWRERGPWLLLLVLPLAALAFRRGWIWVLAPLVLLPAPRSYALTWDDLWQTPDQQAASTLAAGDPARAAELFEHPAWKASALYENGKFDEAAGEFQKIENGDARYNEGNALARKGDLQGAIDAYDKALKLEPANDDARFNKQLVERLLQQQKQQQSGQNQQNPDQNQKGQQGDQEQQGQQGDQTRQAQRGDQQNREGEPSSSDKDGKRSESKAPDETQNASAPDPRPDDGKRDAQREAEQQARGAEDKTSQPGDKDARDAQALSKGDTDERSEQERVLQQWLREIPDDPGGLLRNKFRMQSERARQRGESPSQDQIW